MFSHFPTGGFKAQKRTGYQNCSRSYIRICWAGFVSYRSQCRLSTDGKFLGKALGSLPYNWIVIPIGMVIGYFLVISEPAVHVLSKQVVELSSGAIPKKAIATSLSVGVATSIGLCMIKILTSASILYFVIPGYVIGLILTFSYRPSLLQ